MNLAEYIDHTLLKPAATTADIEKLCREAITYRFAAVCVNPVFVGTARQLLAASAVKVATVVGFPLGAGLTATKVFETAQAVAQGADEIDMVINIGAAREERWPAVTAEIGRVVAAAGGRLVKVIIETALLTDPQKRRACRAVQEGGAQFVKTSTGFAGQGATVADVALIRSVVGDQCGIKAAGGIRTYQQAAELVRAGATRLGTSAGVAIVGQLS